MRKPKEAWVIRTGTLTKKAGPYRKGLKLTTDSDPERSAPLAKRKGKQPVYVDPARFEAWVAAGILDEVLPGKDMPEPGVKPSEKESSNG